MCAEIEVNQIKNAKVWLAVDHKLHNKIYENTLEVKFFFKKIPFSIRVTKYMNQKFKREGIFSVKISQFKFAYKNRNC